MKSHLVIGSTWFQPGHPETSETMTGQAWSNIRGECTEMLLRTTKSGLYCEAGDFYVDPWRAVDRALITHAHADHARSGSKSYLCARPGQGVLCERLGKSISLQTLAYGESIRIGDVKVSLHPAGHVLGSAQIRLELGGEVWVVSGDYKLQADQTCAPFEPVRCHTFITECTFGLPIYRWPDPAEVMDGIHAWWRHNQQTPSTSVLYAYSLGKAQRILACLDPATGPIFVHKTIARLLPHYQAEGISFPPLQKATKEAVRNEGSRALVVAPPSVADTSWIGGAGNYTGAFVSGWMLIRGKRRWQGAGHGFPISDHADWNGLNQAIRETGAGRVLVTHGNGESMVRWLKEQGMEAGLLETPHEKEAD